MPAKQAIRDRRRHPRWRVGDRLAGRIAPNHKASLLDISLGGALIEHQNLVRPKTILFLTLLVPEQEMSLRCRVVRSLVHRHAVWPTGEHDMVYRTALEFLTPSEASRKLINEYIDSMKRIARPARRRERKRSR